MTDSTILHRPTLKVLAGPHCLGLGDDNNFMTEKCWGYIYIYIYRVYIGRMENKMETTISYRFI